VYIAYTLAFTEKNPQFQLRDKSIFKPN